MTAGLERYALDRPPSYITYAGKFSGNLHRRRAWVIVLRGDSAHEGVPYLRWPPEDQKPTFLFKVGTAEYRIPFEDLVEAMPASAKRSPE